MMTAEMIESLSKAKHELISAKARNSGVVAAKEKMKNLLFNYHEELVNLAIENKRLINENKTLEAALEETDQENDELRKKLKETEGKQKKGNAENVESN